MGEHDASYHVLIPYREPTYEMRRPDGPRSAPFTSEFTVRASCSEEAVDEAVRRFKLRALNSSVAWVREIDFDKIRVQQIE